MNPLKPNREEILIEDIAHALTMIPRANGHFPEFYSVAQHSIACCNEALSRGYSNRIALACLLHDASEAYLSDITRPLKHQLGRYMYYENKMQSIIYNIFLGTKLNDDEYELVKSIDDALLYHEFRQFMNEELPISNNALISSPNFYFVPFDKVENEFKLLFYDLLRE